MPLINVHTSVGPLTDDRASILLKQLSQTLAQHLRKPESYVMTCLVPNARMTFAATDAPTCYVEVKSIGGITPQTTKAISRDVTATLSRELNVASDRIFIVFADVPGQLWAHDGGTFG